jgi:long-chain acyl-CoA synthetase
MRFSMIIHGMARRTLIDFFADLVRSPRDFVVYDDGYRAWTQTYAGMGDAAQRFAGRLRAAGLSAGDKVIIWSENRPEWIVALWGCLLEQVVVVPIDYRGSADFLRRVADIVDARVIAVGETVPSIDTARTVWHLDELGPTIHDLRTPSHEPRTTNHESRTTSPDTVAEIIFTSGATADPKGVVLTHRNILANVVPVEREITKYKKYARPFAPIRFLNLLPLSHMFGQSLATFVPPMLDGVVVFTRSYSPQDVLRQIHDRRISILVCVPKMLEVLRDHIVRLYPEAAEPPPANTHWTKRWWIYRRIHRAFGYKFWAFVVGAAPLDPEVENFWMRLGFLVVQGYGLTETAPIVTLNHPLHAARGAVGKPIAGVEVKIAGDGEILVRGDNVTSGYYNAPEETRRAFEGGWFHTGDIGELDATGHLRIRGRKKEMIVTPEGLNVFPDDVERVLNAITGVRDAAVIGAPVQGSTASTERVHAIIVLEPAADLDEVVRQANAQLQDHQKIRGAAVWPYGDLPRTEGTRKLKRRELRQWLTGRETPPGRPEGRDVASVIARFAPGKTVGPETTLDELGLSSLERVELMMALEDAFQVTVDEAGFASATSVGDLERLVQPEAPGKAALVHTGATEVFEFPSWTRSLPARMLRTASLATWILPPLRYFVKLEVRGREHLANLRGPVLFAANHQSHFDTPVILDALPTRWRNCVATAMLKEFFKAHFYPDQFGWKARLTNSTNYYLASLFFNTVPLPQREAGARQTLRYFGELVEEGYSILLFPEGKRTEHGEIVRFQPGVGMIASRLGIPVVPVRIEGLDKILHQSWRFPKRGHARITFGAAMSLKDNDYAAVAARVEAAVRAL